MVKPNLVTVIKIAGTVMGLAGTLASNWTQDKMIKETIKKEVEKALKNK